MLAFDQMASRMHSSGSDPTGMGRWSWMLFKGKNGHATRIVTAYFPNVVNRRKLESVYGQQVSFLSGQSIDVCPREFMISELIIALQDWRAAGEKLLLITDANGAARKRIEPRTLSLKLAGPSYPEATLTRKVPIVAGSELAARHWHTLTAFVCGRASPVACCCRSARSPCTSRRISIAAYVRLTGPVCFRWKPRSWFTRR